MKHIVIALSALGLFSAAAHAEETQKFRTSQEIVDFFAAQAPKPRFVLSPDVKKHIRKAFKNGNGPVKEFVLNRDGCEMLFQQMNIPCMRYTKKVPQQLVDATMQEFLTLNIEEFKPE